MFLELRLNCARVEHRIAQALEAGRLHDGKQLAAALSNAQEYINLAAKAEDGGERERYERIAELYLKITPRLAARG